MCKILIFSYTNCNTKMSGWTISSFLLFEIQFEFSIENFLETKLGNSPIILFIPSDNFTFNLKFNIVLSHGLSLSLSGEYIIQKLLSSLNFSVLTSGSVENSILIAIKCSIIVSQSLSLFIFSLMISDSSVENSVCKVSKFSAMFYCSSLYVVYFFSQVR